MNEEGMDISKLKLKASVHLSDETRPLPRHKPGEKFLKGPVPENWLARASQLPGKAFHVGVAICFLAGIICKPTVQLSHKILRRWGIKRNSAYLALRALERENLISVIRHHGRNPTVTILEVHEVKLYENTHG